MMNMLGNRDSCPSTVKSAKIGSTLKDVIDFDNYYVYINYTRKSVNYQYYYYVNYLGNDNLYYLSDCRGNYYDVNCIYDATDSRANFFIEDGCNMIIVHK